MLMVIHMVKGRLAAERMAAHLLKEGLLVRIHPIYKKLEDEDNYFEIKVLQSESSEARDILADAGLM